ncbi:MAG: autotransporter domain-containing protein [Parasphingorhabdus sp.]|uniref:autotransporter domain-containing protein n=1 Tax=Parasphingorhabdus sp. TaxID=2709688 RepID=UPI003296FB19
MTYSPNPTHMSKARKWLAASSAIAILVSTQAQAQQVIDNGDNVTVTSGADGEIITAGIGVISAVDAAPVVIVNNDDVTVNVAGTLRTTAVTQTVQVNQGTTGAVINNAATGRLEADSRVVNIDGTEATLNNDGTIIGTGSQRNGAVYGNRTSNDIAITNSETGLIDAGVEGAAIAIEVGGGGQPRGGSITNAGRLQGRGQAAPTGGTAGDGLRFFGPGLAPEYVYAGDITNSGVIDSESTQGPVAGVRFANRIGFQGTLTNAEGATISGANNGLYFGNDADHSGGIVNNAGTISSGSRALNIDGNGLTVNNLADGQIIGTGNQRNGTVYADSTAQDFALNNAGIIDAGAGNDGAAFSVELSAAGNSFTIDNSGTIQGRGTAAAGLTTAGDGLRFERTRNAGVLDGTSSGLFNGDIVNSGTIDSEGDSGTTAGIRFVNGVSFAGTIENSGTISGVQNGLYFGNPTPAGGGDFSAATVNNAGTISSGSRALNIDGNGLTVNNSGSIIGTGAQRNGTVYADGTANGFTLNNSGTIDAAVAGSGVSFQLGVNDGDVRSFALTNDGTIAGRGAAQASGASAGLRLFNGAGAGTTVTVADDIVNNGTISSETAAAVLIENIAFTGTFTNSGSLTGASAVDASTALSAVNFVQTGGLLDGDFIGSAFADSLNFAAGNSVLAGNISNNVNVTVADGATLTVSGAQTVAGNFASNGILNFDLGVDSLAIDGDSSFGADSVVNIATTASDNLVAGAPIAVLTETGTFTNNGVTVNVDDDDFLLDYTVDLGSITITPTATDLAAISADANINSFGAAVTSAVAADRLPTDVFNALNNSVNVAAFESTSLSLLPAIQDGVAREIFETQRFASGLLTNRLSSDQSGIWGQIFYRNADRDADSLSALGYDADAISFTLGADARLSDNAKIGILLNYADIEIDAVGSAAAQNDVNSYQISAYAGLDFGAAFLNAELGYSFNDVDSQRVAIGNAITSESDADGIIASLSSGYRLESGSFTITPTAGLRYASLSQDSFTENGGLGLTLDTDRAEFLEASLGLRLSGKADDAKDLSVIPFANIGYSYDLIGDGFGVNGSFNGGLDNFRLIADESSQSRFDLGAGINLVSKNGFSIGAEYQGRFASDYQSHSGGVKVRFEF